MTTINNHLIRGFSYAFPFIVLFSISLAVSETITDISPVPDIIFLFVVPALTLGIATSVAAKPAIVPAIILGYLVNDLGIGFLGGIVAGLLLGYGLHWMMNQHSIAHPSYKNVVNFVGIPILFGGLVYLLMLVLSIPVVAGLDALANWIRGIDSTEVILLVGLLSFLTVIDLGGPFNKLAFTLVLEFYTARAFHITGPAMIAVSIPPISMLLATIWMPNRFETPQPSVKRLMLFGSLFGMTESAIPTITEDVKRRLPVVVLGSVLASMFAAFLGLDNILLMTSVPGLFGVNNILYYLLSYLIGLGSILFLLFLVTPKKALHNDENTI